MKKFWNKLALLLCLLAGFGFVFTACSSGDDGDSPVVEDTDGSGQQDGAQDGGSEGTQDTVVNPITLTLGSETVYSGDDINDAWAAIGSSGDYVLTLATGTYSVTEGTQLSYNGAANIKISGNTTTDYGADVIISGKGSDQSSSKTRCLMEIQGTGNLVLENVTLYSTYRFDSADARKAASNTQAEVLGFDSTGTVAAYNSSFKSHQDTVRTVSKSFFYHCYIEGDVDFMWCEASSKVALYEDCAIKVLGDETTAGYIAAPRTNVASKIWKGLVVLNSTIEIEDGVDAYLFRNPWGTSSTIYNNAAFVNVTVTGTLNASLAKSSANGTSDQQYVGWKLDSTLGDVYASKDSTIGVLSDTTKSNEYSGRKAILNRYYDVANAKFVKDSEANWDIASVISENGWTVAEDTSSELLDGEAEVTVVTYTLNAETVDGVTGDGFAFESGKSHWAGAAESTITIPVSGKCTVAVYGYYAGYGTIKAGDQGEAVYDFNNGTTGATIEKDYVVYDENATSVVITASTASYITKIVVTYDDSIEYVPVTAIAVTGDSDTHTVGVKLALTATITPSNATNSDVKWTSGDEETATVDEYTGKVTFLKAGNVTITATARDGSGVTGTIDCAPTEASWTVAEWYTTDNTLDAEDGMVNADIFSFGSSQYKAMSAASTFTNLSGVSITTSSGLKLNGSGELNFSTTAAATATFIIGNGGKTANELSITSDGGETATLISTSDDTYPTYVYRLSGADSWKVARAGTSEQNPIAYVKVEYDAVWDWQNGSPSSITETNIQGTTTGTVVSNIDGVALTVESTGGKLAYNASGYAQFNAGTVIKVPVKNAGSTLTVVSYPGQYKYTVGGTDASDNTTEYTVTSDDVTTGYVEIAATATGYLYSISLTNPL